MDKIKKIFEAANAFLNSKKKKILKLKILFLAKRNNIFTTNIERIFH